MRRPVLYSSLLLALGGAALAPGCSSAQSDAERIADAQEALKDGFSAAEWATLKTLSPLPDLPVDTTNKYADSPAAAKLGQMLFFDKRIAGPIQAGTLAEGQLGNVGDTQKIACADCHMPASGWLFDVRSNNGGPIPNATALGSAWMTRNVSSLVNTAFYVQGSGRSAPHWRENDGFSDSEWFDAQSEPEGPPVQNGSRLQLVHLIFDHYRSEYDAAFYDWPLDPAIADLSRFPATGSPTTDVANWSSMTPADQEIINRALANYGKAIEAFLRKLVSRNAPFDRYMAGDHDAIGEDAKKGAKLFVGKAQCVGCHYGPLFSDDDFHSTGLHIDTSLSPHADPTETGRSSNQGFICGSDFNVDGPYSDDRSSGRLAGFCSATIPNGMWRTKTLRQVAETAPYMRDGQMATLDDVIDFYDRGGDPDGTFIGGPKEIQPLHLDKEEKKHLKAFLKTLTGDKVPKNLVKDIHKP